MPANKLEFLAGGPTERTKTMFGLLDQLKSHIAALRQQEYIEPEDERNRERARTHEELGALYGRIQDAKQDSLTWDEYDDRLIEMKAEEVQEEVMNYAKTPPWVLDLVNGMREGAAALAEKVHNDPGAGLEAVVETASVGGRVAGGSAGYAFGTALATVLPLGPVGAIGGTLAGTLLAPSLINFATTKITNPKLRAIAKVGLYGSIAAGTLFFLPEAITALGIGAGFAGIASIGKFFHRRSQEKKANEIRKRRAAYEARMVPPTTMPIRSQPQNQGSPEVAGTMAA